MKILALAATNHKASINAQLITHTLSLFSDQHEIKTIDLNDFELKLFSPERLEKNGVPKKCQKFVELTQWADLIIISFAEYNGSYTPVFKNLLDWASTTKQEYFKGKKLFLMATSPGGRGAQGVLKSAASFFPFMGGTIVGTFSLPRFFENFKDKKIINPQFHTELQHLVQAIENPIIRKKSQTESTLDQISKLWVWCGYGLFFFIALNGLLHEPWFIIDGDSVFWKIAMFAATFTLLIRPIYDLWPESQYLESLLKWRKGIGLISSGIVVGYWISRNIDLQSLDPLMYYFSQTKWSLSLENILERTTEITALTLFLISNKWLVKNYNRLWRQLQKLAYVYFLSAALLLTVVHEKLYGATCLILFFMIYQVWVYARLNRKIQATGATRHSQAS